jgi:hypothetical protein
VNTKSRIGLKLFSIASNAGLALISFFASFLLLKYESHESFGAFSIFMIVQVLLIGISNALFVSQMMLSLNKQDAIFDIKFLIFPHHIFALCGSLFQLLLVYLMTNSSVLGVLASFLSLVQCYRWFLRGYFQNVSANTKAVQSDVLVVICTICLFLYFMVNDEISIYTVLESLIISNVIGLILLLLHSKNLGFFCGFKDNDKFKIAFDHSGKDALRGAVTAEFSSNFHLYMVLLIFGPAYVAIIAAANLIFRPVSIVHLSIQQTERTHVRRVFLAQDFSELRNILRKINFLVFGFFGLNIICAIVVVLYFPSFVWSDSNTLADWEIAVILCGLIGLLRTFRTTGSLVLQAVGNFRNLADATMVSAMFVLAAAPALAYCYGPVYSLFSILGAEIIMVYLIRKHATSELVSMENELTT